MHTKYTSTQVHAGYTPGTRKKVRGKKARTRLGCIRGEISLAQLGSFTSAFSAKRQTPKMSFVDPLLTSISPCQSHHWIRKTSGRKHYNRVSRVPQSTSEQIHALSCVTCFSLSFFYRITRQINLPLPLYPSNSNSNSNFYPTCLRTPKQQPTRIPLATQKPFGRITRPDSTGTASLHVPSRGRQNPYRVEPSTSTGRGSPTARSPQPTIVSIGMCSQAMATMLQLYGNHQLQV